MSGMPTRSTIAASMTHSGSVGHGAVHARGTAHVLAAFDLGFEIDLARAAERLSVGHSSEAFRHKRGPSEEPGTPRRPLRFLRAAPSIELGTLRTSDRIEIAVYPFGAVSLSHTIPIDGPLEELVETSVLLYDHPALQAEVRREAQALLEELGDAVREPLLTRAFEDYVVYELEPGGLAAWPPGEQAERLARLLRAERGSLSSQEIENALAGRIAYRPDELVLVDWFGALLVGHDMEDERRVLELATVELVELRFLDGRLTERLDQAYGLLRRSRSPVLGLEPRTRELERLARFQADSAILHESSDNALKLLGDDYLARLYELCSERFHFAAWDTAIERKLATLDSIYSKISDLASRRRSEILEWIIILLFVVDILLILFGGRHG